MQEQIQNLDVETTSVTVWGIATIHAIRTAIAKPITGAVVTLVSTRKHWATRAQETINA